MNSDYKVGDLIYDANIYDGMNTDLSDLQFYKRWLPQSKGARILELCCGTGRLTLPIARDGYNISGVDYTPSMLAQARLKASEAGLEINFIEADIRTLNLQEKYDLIFIPFNSIHHLYKNEDLFKVFNVVKNHLKDGGLFLLDCFNPNIQYIVEGEKEQKEIAAYTTDDGREVLIKQRIVHERNCRLDDPDCSVHLNTLMEQAVLRAEYSFEVLPGSGRKKRVACMELRFERVTLCAPVNGPAKGSPPVSLYCIHVKEKSSSTPVNESPIEWRLLTTHVVETVEQAIECIGWYRCRWLIEELFRVLKRKGFMIEDAQLETVSALQKLILISLQAALQVMVLKLSFDKEDEKLSSEIYFTSKEIALLHIVGKKSEGNTKIQQNPYKKESMAWAAWIIARLGAWSAYKSQSIPGYITFKNGLDRFNTQFELYELIS